MAGRPKNAEKRVKITLSLTEASVDMIEAVHYSDREVRSDFVDDAIRELFEKKEKERGEPYPKRK
jgi:metal-responsive CopG/Arc/MetJ family transcriptional regulator